VDVGCRCAVQQCVGVVQSRRHNTVLDHISVFFIFFITFCDYTAGFKVGLRSGTMLGKMWRPSGIKSYTNANKRATALYLHESDSSQDQHFTYLEMTAD